jgi:hypothetical protein
MPQQEPSPLPTLLTISNLLNTGLSESSLQALHALVAAGAKPEALVAVVKELRREKEEKGAE